MQQMIQEGQDMSGNSYYPPESDLTGGLPINLDSLRDGPPGSKPFYPYSTLIRYASVSGLLGALGVPERDTRARRDKPLLTSLQLCHQRISQSEAFIGRYLLRN